MSVVGSSRRPPNSRKRSGTFSGPAAAMAVLSTPKKPSK
jgi:hypothetical protein